MLASQLAKWSNAGKQVIKPFNPASPPESSADGLPGLVVMPDEAHSLIQTNCYNFTYDIVNDSFTDFINEKLAQKIKKTLS
ncbi:hypothetical protein ABK905_24665 [Acerihabitans sp. KWT182]|uniref:Uncharacterized protein n=1 Tax=Acerihabitans sp. KWT182 TaxID=3157919 RepID=A0AAU7Q903_9GAMM